MVWILKGVFSFLIMVWRFLPGGVNVIDGERKDRYVALADWSLCDCKDLINLLIPADFEQIPADMDYT